MTDLPLVIIILVNWNRPQDTLDCIRSINASTYPNYNIIVVDNGSSDDSILRLREQHLSFILLESGDNLGFTGGNNMGIRYAMNLNFDYVLLLNNDTLVAPDTLDKMVRVAESNKSIGIVTPKILFHPQQQLIWAAGTDYDDRFMIGTLSGYKMIDIGQFDHERTLVWATGCAMLIPMQVIQEVGLLGDDYFAVVEDIDFSMRVSKAGFSIRYEPCAIIWHKESASAGGHDAPQYVYYQMRNYILFHKRCSINLPQLMMSHAFFFLYASKRLFRFALRAKWRSCAGIALGIRDAFINRLGRREYSILSTSRQ